MDMTTHRRDLAIWGYAFGYFACYAPYSALTKALSQGALDGMTRGVSGFELLPWSTLASGVGMFLFLTARGWWQHASTRTVDTVQAPTSRTGRPASTSLATACTSSRASSTMDPDTSRTGSS